VYLYELVGGKVHNVMVSTPDQAIIFDDHLNGVKLGIRMDGNNHAIRTCRKDSPRPESQSDSTSTIVLMADISSGTIHAPSNSW